MVDKSVNTKITALGKNISQWAKEAIVANKEQIVNVVKYGQLSIGKNSLGAPLAFEDTRTGQKGTGYYAESTQSLADADGISRSKAKGSPYDFFWTGETLEQMYLKSVNKSKATYSIYSKTGKAKLLENLYGDIFDLTDENNDWVNIFIIEPYVSEKLEEEIVRIILNS